MTADEYQRYPHHPDGLGQHLNLSAAALESMEGVLGDLIREGELRFAAVLDESGMLLASRSAEGHWDRNHPDPRIEIAGALAAGALASASVLASQFGDRLGQDLIIHGQDLVIGVRPLPDRFVLLYGGPATTPVGVVRHCASRAELALESALGTVRTTGRPVLEPDPAESALCMSAEVKNFVFEIG